LNRNDNANSKPALTKQFDQWICGAAIMAMTMMEGKTTEQHQEISRRELVDGSSTVLCSSESIHSIPGLGILSQLLVCFEVC